MPGVVASTAELPVVISSTAELPGEFASKTEPHAVITTTAEMQYS